MADRRNVAAHGLSVVDTGNGARHHGHRPRSYHDSVHAKLGHLVRCGLLAQAHIHAHHLQLTLVPGIELGDFALKAVEASRAQVVGKDGKLVHKLADLLLGNKLFDGYGYILSRFSVAPTCCF